MSTQTFADRRSLEGFKPGLVVVGGLLAFMWVLEIIDSASFHALDQFGIVARQLGSIPHVLTAPWLHFGYPHLISNSVPFLILGLLTWLAGPGRWLAVTLTSIVTSGLVVWLIASPHSITLGASGLVFGYLAYRWCVVSSRTTSGRLCCQLRCSSSTAPPCWASCPPTQGCPGKDIWAVPSAACWQPNSSTARIPRSDESCDALVRQMTNSGTRGTSLRPVNRSSSGIIVGTFEITSW